MEIRFSTVTLDLEPLQGLALDSRPELLMARKKLEAAEAKLREAKRQWVPDPSLRVEASRYNDGSQVVSEVMAGGSINLPWVHRRKYKAAIEEANQMKISAEFEQESAQKEALGRVRAALQKVETLDHHVEPFPHRVPRVAPRNPC